MIYTSLYVYVLYVQGALCIRFRTRMIVCLNIPVFKFFILITPAIIRDAWPISGISLREGRMRHLPLLAVDNTRARLELNSDSKSK